MGADGEGVSVVGCGKRVARKAWRLGAEVERAASTVASISWGAVCWAVSRIAGEEGVAVGSGVHMPPPSLLAVARWDTSSAGAGEEGA